MNIKEVIPEFLIEMIEKQYDEETMKKILEGYSKKRKTTIRVNTLKSDEDKIKKILKENNIEFESVKWSKEAIIIKNADEEILKQMDIYIKGEIYMQSLSSMLPPIILKPEEGKDILDMAAAPGGKTTQIAALTHNNAHITACEKNKIRAERLKYNIEKQGANCVFVMEKDARNIEDFFAFDQILLDAPCSGSGTINIDNKNLKKVLTKQLVDRSTETQKKLLKKAIQILKKGESMVYSTCSILQEENENVVEEILKNKNVILEPIEFEGIENIPKLKTKLKETLCVCPNEHYEGFFVAKIKKI